MMERIYMTTDEKIKRYEDNPSNLVIDQCGDPVMWAKSWQATCKQQGISVGDIDEAYMTTWLSNAMTYCNN